MNQKGSASRGELTKAMSATIKQVREHQMQIAALIAGMQQLMDGQAALGEALEALKREDEDRKNVEFFSVPLHGPLEGV